jgi:hypothetical protein
MFPDKSNYRFVPFYSKLSVDHFVQVVQVNTDISVFPFSNIIKSQNLTFTNERVYTYVPSNTAETEFMRCFFRVHSSEALVERKVQSLEDFLSFLGGIFTILQLVGMLILTPYSKFRLKLKIFNKLYKIEEEKLNCNFLDYLAEKIVPDCAIKSCFKGKKLDHLLAAE